MDHSANIRHHVATITVPVVGSLAQSEELGLEAVVWNCSAGFFFPHPVGSEACAPYGSPMLSWPI